MLTGTYKFTFTTPFFLSGLIVTDLEFDGRVSFSFTPGEPECGPSYASGGEPATDPEIEITEIEVYGHPDQSNGAKATYAVLSPSDLLWLQIEKYLIDECFSEMCDEIDDPLESRADEINDRLRDERLMDDAA